MKGSPEDTYLDDAGEGVRFGAGFGAGDGDRLRPSVEEGADGLCPRGEGNCFSFWGWRGKIISTMLT